MKARCNTIILLGIFITALMACSSAPKKESLADTQQVTAHQGSNAEIHSEHSEEMPVDPYESANRKTYSFTDSIDRFILEPVADVYIDYVPYACIFNSTGHPAITVPMGLSKKGLPIGIQIVGKYYSEPELLHLAKLLKPITPGFIKPKE